MIPNRRKGTCDAVVRSIDVDEGGGADAGEVHGIKDVVGWASNTGSSVRVEE